jgi:hypothetical protein
LSRTRPSSFRPPSTRRALEHGLDQAAAAGQGAVDQGVEHLQDAVGVDQSRAVGVAVIGE